MKHGGILNDYPLFSKPFFDRLLRRAAAVQACGAGLSAAKRD